MQINETNYWVCHFPVGSACSLLKKHLCLNPTLHFLFLPAYSWNEVSLLPCRQLHLSWTRTSDNLYWARSKGLANWWREHGQQSMDV